MHKSNITNNNQVVEWEMKVFVQVWFHERYLTYYTYTQILEHDDGGHEFIPKDHDIRF
jgi:hypothetical protein